MKNYAGLIIANLLINFIFFIATSVMFSFNFNNMSDIIENQNKALSFHYQVLQNENRLLNSQSNLNAKLNKVNNKILKKPEIIVLTHKVVVPVPVAKVIIKLVKPVLPANYKKCKKVHPVFGNCK